MPRLPALLLACCLIPAVPAAEAPAADSLYRRLGGEAGMAAIAGGLIDRSASDPATRRSFAKVDIPRLKKLLAEQFCQLSGGPCRYSGDSMKQVHAGLGIDEAEFYGMVAHLREVLDARGAAQADKNALLALLAPMRRDVVDKP
ncbi:group I truncated hemoglobin [Chitinimonas koreensis]|uniref:group I truncated hemoglobin n=1 Tax=Chitinimonas koreensis TaxID=356302 RepID=UPI00048E6BBE|nr:group 1 truncated hemoglobin [Chitinimonas koreensis]QNM97002.1 group 1 truncated hemoglobin [Chitinimonas koreensis]